MLNRASRLWWLAGVALAASLAGCAAAYHDYADGCIPCSYCAPRPLPYTTYEACHCPTPMASRYAQQDADVSANPFEETDPPVNAPTAAAPPKAAAPFPE
jgi:hypothetical protein